MKRIAVLLIFAMTACAQPPKDEPLASPSGLEVTNLTETTVSLSWSAVPGDIKYRWALIADGYVERGIIAESTLSVEKIPDGKDFVFSVRCESGEKVSEWAEIKFSTPELPPPPVVHSIPAVFIGDSITEIWPTKDPSYFNSHGYLGKGKSGQTSKTIAARFKKDVVNNDPYVVHILCGGNDIAENDGSYVESSAILANIEMMADMADEAKIKVVVGAILPVTKFWWWADDWKPSKEGVTIESHILEANALIKAWCEQRGYPYVDYYNLLVGPNGSFPGPDSYDGVHPDTPGFQKMDALVQPVMEELLKDAVL